MTDRKDKFLLLLVFLLSCLFILNITLGIAQDHSTIETLHIQGSAKVL